MVFLAISAHFQNQIVENGNKCHFFLPEETFEAFFCHSKFLATFGHFKKIDLMLFFSKKKYDFDVQK